MARNSSGRLTGWFRRLLGRAGPVIPVVRLHGVIAADQRPGRLNIAGVAPLLKRAFAIKSAPAIAIIVNSPGGSPVQSRLISKRIRDLADEHGKPVLVFVEDAAASVADRHYVVEQGKVIDMIPNDQLDANIGKIEAYLGV